MEQRTTDLSERAQIFLGGRWVDSTGSESGSVVNPGTGESFGSFPMGTAEDVDRAVAAARAGFETWSRTSPRERGEWMGRIADGIARHAEQFAEVISAELGSPPAQALSLHVKMGINDFALMPDAISDIVWEEELGNSVVYRVPKGVIGAITPWNYPLHQITTKVAGALAAGCTVVLKPSVETPLTAFLFADVLEELGLPDGVFNLVSGSGRVVGESLVTHPDVDMVSFTGSTTAGKRISELAARSVKPVSMELGGKSASVILEGADIRRAVEVTLTKTFQNAGQSCSAPTRLLAPRELLQEVADVAAGASEPYSPAARGDFPGRIGPVVSEAQLASIRNYIDVGVSEGATLVRGGSDVSSLPGTGFYVEPTVFSDVRNDMVIAREEIFGPVLVIIPFDSEEEAIRLANESDYGLSGAVWAGTAEQAARVARQLRTGQVSINGGLFNPGAPFGGFKQSGHGRENGRFGIEEFLTYTSLQF